MDSHQGPTVLVQCHVAAWMGGGALGRMDTWTCMANLLCCPPETITTLLISYTPIQKKRTVKKKISVSQYMY